MKVGPSSSARASLSSATALPLFDSAPSSLEPGLMGGERIILPVWMVTVSAQREECLTSEAGSDALAST